MLSAMNQHHHHQAQPLGVQQTSARTTSALPVEYTAPSSGLGGLSRVGAGPMLGSATSLPQVANAYTVSDVNLYRPEGCDLIPAGQTLRGGMTPIYNTSAVRTFEAPPVFSATSPSMMADAAAANPGGKKRAAHLDGDDEDRFTASVQGAGSVDANGNGSPHKNAPRSGAAPSPARKRFVCC